MAAATVRVYRSISGGGETDVRISGVHYAGLDNHQNLEVRATGSVGQVTYLFRDWTVLSVIQEGNDPFMVAKND